MSLRFIHFADFIESHSATSDAGRVGLNGRPSIETERTHKHNSNKNDRW